MLLLFSFPDELSKHGIEHHRGFADGLPSVGGDTAIARRRDSAPPNSADEGAKQPAACPARVAVPPTPACLLPVNVYARIYV